MAKKKKKKLTGLAAALVNAGHLDEKKARKIQREQRKEDRDLGRDVVEEREAQKAAEAIARREAEAEANRAREAARQAAETEHRALRTVREFHDPFAAGRRQWWFEARDGRFLFLNVSDGAARLLSDGLAGIVESVGVTDREHVLVNGDKPLTTLIGIDKDLVRFWNRAASA